MNKSILDVISDDNLHNESISLTNTLKLIETLENRLKDDGCHMLFNEIIAETLNNLKIYSSMSIEDALNDAYNDWVK